MGCKAKWKTITDHNQNTAKLCNIVENNVRKGQIACNQDFSSFALTTFPKAFSFKGHRN